MSPVLPSVAAVVIIASAAAGCGGSSTKTVTAPATPAATTSKAPTKTTPAFADLVSQVRTGVIRIETATCDGQSIGTGFLIGRKLIASVEHVIDGGESVILKQGGHVVGHGTVIGSDSSRDVALIRSDHPISGHVFNFADAAPRLGDSVAAIGFPLGLPLSVTRGSISGNGRTVPIDGLRRRGLVQTDAALNPGNSGGPLLAAADGKVVGLVDIGSEANGISFAVNAKVAFSLLNAWKASPQPAINASGCSPSSSSSPAPATQPAAAQPTKSYDGAEFAIDYPAAWRVKSAEEPKSFGSDTVIVDPNDPQTLIRIDKSAHGGSPAADAQPVIAALRRDSSYEEIDVSHSTLGGQDALHWEFRVREQGHIVHKEDVFFTDEYGQGVAILTSAPDSRYDALAGIFAALRDSYTSYQPSE